MYKLSKNAGTRTKEIVKVIIAVNKIQLLVGWALYLSPTYRPILSQSQKRGNPPLGADFAARADYGKPTQISSAQNS